jgi:hypothetical protein
MKECISSKDLGRCTKDASKRAVKWLSRVTFSFLTATLVYGCCSTELVDSKGRVIVAYEYVSAKHPRGCVEFTMDAGKAYVEVGGYMRSVGNYDACPITTYEPKNHILRVFSAPGSRKFRISPLPDSNCYRDYTIMIKDQMVTPVQISTELISRSYYGSSTVEKWRAHVMPGDAVPMGGGLSETDTSTAK